MATLYTHKDKNIRKTWFWMTFFFLAIIFLGYVIAWVYDDPGILVIAVGYSMVSSIASYWWSDKIVLRMSGAKQVTKETAPELMTMVETLAITAGLPMPSVHVIPDNGLNAFATGRNPEHAAIAVTSGLLDMLDRTELEGVLAHELSHIGNRDILLSTVVVILAGTIALMSDLFFRFRLFGGGRRDNGNAGSALALVGLALLVLAPIAAALIQLAISRKREFLADASGALLTRYPEGLASALQKIGGQSAVKKSSKATAHLFIASPFKGKRVMRLFATHPPIEKRIEALMQGGNVHDQG